MFSTALLTIPAEKLVNGDTQLISWLSTAVVFLMLGVLLILSQSYVFRRLLAALTKSRELSRELAADITERKQAEKKLYEAEARYRTLVEQIPAITYIAALDEASTTLYVSPQIETILGFSPAEYQANPDMWRERLHPDDRERVLAEVARSHAMGKPLVSDYRMLTRDGHVVWFHDEAALVRNADGRPLFLQGVMLDITERKRIEMTLQESELRYRSLVETSPDAIALVDLDFRRLLCNRQDAVLHGYESTEEMIGRNILDLVAPEDLPRAMGYVRRL